MKVLALTSLAGASLILAAGMAQQSLLAKQAQTLQDAKTLKVTYTFQHVPGDRAVYKLTYSKPDLLLIEGPSKTIESDGKTLWEYDKTANQYTETQVTPELLAKKIEGNEELPWASFFSEGLAKNATMVKAGSSRQIAGNPVTEVNFSLGSVNPRQVTFYVDDKLGVARGAAIKDSSGDMLVMATKIEIGQDAMSASDFQFSAPSGATKAVAPVASGASWSDVSAILNNNCTPCHSGRGRGGFSIDSYESVMKGSEDGPVITAGDPDGSLIVKLITGQASPKMPPRKTLEQADIDKIKAWIKAGAKQQ